MTALARNLQRQVRVALFSIACSILDLPESIAALAFTLRLLRIAVRAGSIIGTEFLMGERGVVRAPLFFFFFFFLTTLLLCEQTMLLRK
jgi:hypothetical protein